MKLCLHFLNKQEHIFLNKMFWMFREDVYFFIFYKWMEMLFIIIIIICITSKQWN